MRSPPRPGRLPAELPAALAGLLDVPIDRVAVRLKQDELVASAGGHTFAVEWSGATAAGPVASRAARAAERATGGGRGRAGRIIPVVAVPFMSPAGRRACEAARVAWFDLAGNAHIVAPGVRVIVDGRPNHRRGPGRPASLFAPKSARVARWLLTHPGEAFTQRAIARATDMTEGFVSRIVAGLERDHYVVRDERGALRVPDPALLLDAWSDDYQFTRHTLIAGHVAARSGDALARVVGDTLAAARVEHAATGLAAAWQLTRFAAFRIATFYVTAPPSAALTTKLGFREDARGANLWLVVPNDAGVLQGAEDHGGVRCVHPVQAYLDLKAHPERAPEAAERLRTALIVERRDG
jgi:hypothetical protein